MTEDVVSKYVQKTDRWISGPVGIAKMAEWDRMRLSYRKKLEYAVMFACPEKNFRGTSLQLIADALEGAIDARPFNGD